MADTPSTGNATPTVDQATPSDTAQSTEESVQLAQAAAVVQVSAPARGADVSLTVEPGQTVELKDPVLRFTQDGPDLVIHWADLGDTHTTLVEALAAGTPLVLADGTPLTFEQVLARIPDLDPGAFTPAAGPPAPAAAGGAYNTPTDFGTLGPEHGIGGLLLGTELQFGLIEAEPFLIPDVGVAVVPAVAVVLEPGECDELRAEFDAAVAAYSAAFPDVKGLGADASDIAFDDLDSSGVLVGDLFVNTNDSISATIDVSNSVIGADGTVAPFDATNDLLDASGSIIDVTLVGDAFLNQLDDEEGITLTVDVSNFVSGGDNNLFNAFADVLIGGDENDILVGDAFLNAPSSNEMSVTIDVSNGVVSGNNNIFNAFDDLLNGGAGNDLLVGDLNVFIGGSSPFELTVDVSNTVFNGDGNQFNVFDDGLIGGDGDDELVGDLRIFVGGSSPMEITIDISNFVEGGSNNSFFAFNDMLDGGAGNDFLVGDISMIGGSSMSSLAELSIDVDNTINGGFYGEGADDNSFTAFSDMLEGGTGNDILVGDIFHNQISSEYELTIDVSNSVDGEGGTADNNSFSVFDDILDGGPGADLLVGDIFIDKKTNDNMDYSIDLSNSVTDGDNNSFSAFNDFLLAGPGGVAGGAVGGLDLYILEDLTGSFRDDLPNASAAVADLISRIGGDLPSDTQMGVGSFKDKSDGLSQIFVKAQNLTIDFAAVQAAIDGFSASGGGDTPEAQIEALFHLAKDAGEIGFRDGAAKVVVLTTDAPFHVAGDAPGGGFNDGDGDIEVEDYPTLDQLKSALEDAGIVPIFAVTAGVVSTYQALVDFLGFGTVVVLSSDSSNMVEAILEGLGEIVGPGDTLVGDYLIRTDQTVDNNNDISIDVSNSIDGGVNNTFDAFGDVLLGGLGNDLLVGDMMLEGQSFGEGGGSVDIFIDVQGNGDINLFNDKLCGDAGDDVLYGDFFADDGGSFNITFNGLGYLAFLDTLDSEDFTLTMFEDTLDGASGNDDLIGGFGDDTLTGGLGDDTFLYGVGLEPGSADVIYSTDISDFISSLGFTVANEDLVKLEHGAFSVFFDGGSNSLSPGDENIDAVHVVSTDAEGEFIFSTEGGGNVPGVGGFEDEDLIRFDDGTFSLFFDASANSFDLDGEGPVGIDALFVTDVAAGSFIFSTDTSGELPGVGFIGDEDLILFDGAGNYSLFFDGSANSLSAEDIDALFVTDVAAGSFIFSTETNANLPGVGSFSDEDLVLFDGVTDTYSLFLDGSDVLEVDSLDALHVLSIVPNLSTDGNDTILDFGDGDDVVDLDALFDALGVGDGGAREALVTLTDDGPDTVLTVTGQTDFSITFAGLAGVPLTVGTDDTFDINVGTFI